MRPGFGSDDRAAETNREPMGRGRRTEGERRRSPARRSRPRRSVVGGLAAVVLLGALLVTPTAGSAPAACASAEGLLHLGVVVDYGVAAADGAPANPVARCVRLGAGANGFDVLAAAGITWRTNSAGLVCALSPQGSTQLFPASGCGERTANGYRYWAYFHGRDGMWTYAGDGPYAHRMAEGEVDGWHFVEGTGRPGDPAPNGPASTAQLCPPEPPPTVTTPPSTAGLGGPAPTVAPPVPGNATPPPTLGGSPVPAPGPAFPGSPTSTPPGATDAGDPTGAPDNDGAPSATDGGAAPGTGVTGSSMVGGASGGDGGAAAIRTGADLAATPLSTTAPPTDGGVPVGALGAVVAALVLGGLAARRFAGGGEPA